MVFCERMGGSWGELGDDLPEVILPKLEILQQGFEMVQCVSFFASKS